MAELRMQSRGVVANHLTLWRLGPWFESRRDYYPDRIFLAGSGVPTRPDRPHDLDTPGAPDPVRPNHLSIRLSIVPTVMSLSRLETESLTALHWVAVALAVVSGVIHLVIGIQFFPGAQPIAFVLAGLGFFGAVVLFLLDYRRRLLYLVGIPFVVLQILLYLWLNYRVDPPISPIEGIDKAAQIVLIVLLVVLYRREA